MNKFKVGQKVKIIRTGKIGKIAEVDNEDFDEEGRSNNCYGVRYKGWRYSYWFTVHDLEEVKDILTAKEKEYLSNIIKPFRNKVENIKKYECAIGIENIVILIKNSIPKPSDCCEFFCQEHTHLTTCNLDYLYLDFLETCLRIKYEDYLNSLYWQLFRENILKKHNYSCSMCNSCEDVNVYHLNKLL